MIKHIQKEIDENKKYHLPKDIRVIEYDNRYIVIAVETGNWLILNNSEEVHFFNLLQSKTIKEAISLSDCGHNTIKSVITQLEAKDFENISVLKSEMPLSLHFHLTNACNMRCPMCYMSANKKLQNELSTSEVFDILDNFSSEGGEKVTFTGGEIATRKDLLQIVQRANRNGLKVELLSNGTLWTPEMIDSFSPLIDKIQISIDGYSEDTNARVRGKGNFAKALDVVDQFVHHNVMTEIAMTPYYDQSYKENYIQYADFGKVLSRKYDNFKFKVKYSGVLLDGRERKFSQEEKEDYNSLAEKIYLEIFGNVNDFQFINFHKNHGIQDVCNYGNLTITSTGQVYLCPQIPELNTIANVRECNFHDLVELSKKAKVAANVANILPCRECELKYICGGDCRIKYFSEFRHFEDVLDGKMPQRECNISTKHKFYNLMIKYNADIYQ